MKMLMENIYIIGFTVAMVNFGFFIFNKSEFSAGVFIGNLGVVAAYYIASNWM